jgi:hypothetical protein
VAEALTSTQKTRSSSPIKNGSGSRDTDLGAIPTLYAIPTVPGSVVLIHFGIYAAIFMGLCLGLCIPLFVFGLVM